VRRWARLRRYGVATPPSAAAQLAGRRQQPHAFVPESIDVWRDGALRREPQPVWRDQIAGARGMNVERQDHWRRLDAGVGEVEAQLDFHDIFSG
jgi:hypothetical protein